MEAILRGFLQKWKVECRADGLVPMRFAIFPLHLSKVLRLPRKSDARSYEVLHLSGKIILANLKIGCSKMQPLSGNQRPHLLTAPMKMSLVLRLPRKMHLCRSSSNVPRLPTLVKHVLLRCRILCACHAKPHLNLQKWSEHGVFLIHFDSETRFAPQRRALFRHLNFQKCSERGALCTFWLRNVLRPQQRTFSTSQLQKALRCFVHFDFDVLRATTACNFSSRIWPDVAAPAALASLLFDPPGPQNHWKIHTESRLFYLFAHLHLLSSDSFSTLILVSSSLRLSDSSHLCSSFLHIVGSLTSKLPLVMLHVIALKRERSERERENLQRSFWLWYCGNQAWKILKSRMSAPSCFDVFAGTIQA